VTLFGRDVTELGPERRAALGLFRSFQDLRLFPGLAVREALAVALGPRAPRGSRLQRRLDNLVEAFGLGPEQGKRIEALSTGVRRVVDLACLRAAEPRVLLLDEPSAGLAQAETELLGGHIAGLARETGCAVLVIEHDLPLLAGLAQRMYVLEAGRVIAEGPPAAVLTENAVIGTLLAG
jgi:ABC-type branched-subunit amino acid transport system ATPase component